MAYNSYYSQGGAPQYSNYGSPPPPPPPGYNTLSLVPGWATSFDINAQRWFYIEQATGRTQWEAPPPAAGPYDASRGYGGEAAGYAGAAAGGPGYYAGAEQNQGGGYGGEPVKEKSDKSGMLLAAAGGLAVGAIGGAIIAHELAEDDNEEQQRAAALAAAANGDPSMPPGILPPTDADGDSVSSSDRESVQEAREEYEEALAEAADSDASSSDQEELEEAREEYIEEYEENYE